MRTKISSPHPVDIHVGRRLRLRRTILGMSQEALGNTIGVTFQQIQKYERGINRIGSSRLYEFGEILKVPVSFFFEEFSTPENLANNGSANLSAASGLAEESDDSFQHEQIASRETLEMVRAYYKIKDPTLRKRIFELVKVLSDETEEAAKS